MNKKALLGVIVAILAIVVIIFVVSEGYKPKTIEKFQDEYIFKNSNRVLLVEEDINNMSEFTLTLAANEIFARYGLIFTDGDVNEYFNNLKWYKPNKSVDDSTDRLNEVEKANLTLIERRIRGMKQGNWYIGEQEIEIDLDGDGKLDTLSFKVQEVDLIGSNLATITVNDAKIDEFFSRPDRKLYLANTNVKDNYVDFYVVVRDESGYNGNTFFFRYKDGVIEKLPLMPGVLYSYDGKGMAYHRNGKIYDNDRKVIESYNTDNGETFEITDEDLEKMTLNYDKERTTIYKGNPLVGEYETYSLSADDYKNLKIVELAMHEAQLLVMVLLPSGEIGIILN